MKCDEGKPQCNRCLSSGRVCDGYLTGDAAMSRRQLAETVRNLNVVGPVSRALTQRASTSNPASRPVSPEDNVYFDLFQHATVPATCNLFSSTFWTETVLQMAHEEPAIWHSTLAIAALHRRTDALAESKNPHHEQALVRRAEAHYAKALTLSQDLISDVKVATLSALLISASSLLGRWGEMQKHIMAGLKIVARRPESTPGLQSIEQTLLRLDLLAMTFSESSAPYPYHLTAAAFPVEHFLTLPRVEGTSYEELMCEMFGLFRTFMILDNSFIRGKDSYGPWSTVHGSFLRRLAHWESKMAEFETARRPTSNDERTRLSIRLWHVLVRILVRASNGPETRYDPLLGYFEYATKIAAAIIELSREGNTSCLSLEPGLIVPLWAIIHRCRHRWLRHAALDLLHEYNRVESMWKSSLAAAAIGTLVNVEEESLSPMQPASPMTALLKDAPLTIPWSRWSKPDFDIPTSLSWADVPMIPETSRVKDLLGLVSSNLSGVEICLLMCADPAVSSSQPGTIREVSVHT